MLEGIGTGLSELADSINKTAKDHRGGAAIVIDLVAIYLMYTTRKPMVFCSAAGALVGNTIAWLRDATFTKQILSTVGGASVGTIGSYFFPAEAAKVHQAVMGFFGISLEASTETSTDAVSGENKDSDVMPEDVKEEVKAEVSAESEVKAEVSAESEVKAEVSVEPEVKAEVSAESEVKAEVSVESEGKGEVSVESEVKAEVSTESEVKAEVSAESEGTTQVPADSEGIAQVDQQDAGQVNRDAGQVDGNAHVVKKEADLVNRDAGQVDETRTYECVVFDANDLDE